MLLCADAGAVVERERRSLAYRPRRLAPVDIDAFNEGLHNKRPRLRYDTIDDLHWKTDRQAASLI